MKFGMLPVMRDPGSIPRGGYLCKTGIIANAKYVAIKVKKVAIMAIITSNRKQ
jgi:hypothetical protein